MQWEESIFQGGEFDIFFESCPRSKFLKQGWDLTRSQASPGLIPTPIIKGGGWKSKPIPDVSRLRACLPPALLPAYLF